MSGIIHKLKDAVTGDKHETHTDRASGATSQNPRNVPGYDGRNTASTNADRREDSHFRDDSRTGGYGYTGSDYVGLRFSDADPRYSSGLDSSGNMGDYHAGAAVGYGSTNFGQRDSNVDNQLDPRANRDGSYVQYEPIGANRGYSDRTSPHSSHVANKLDPRDSDLYGTRNTGPRETDADSMTYSSFGGYGTAPTDVNYAGPNYPDISDRLDPYAESDTSGFRSRGDRGNGLRYSPTHGSTGGFNTTNKAGNIYGSRSAEIDRDDPLDGSRGVGAGNGNRTGNAFHGGGRSGSFTGPGSNTAGPHRSDFLNKMDPRVDSGLGRDYDEGEVRHGRRSY
ncbi:hypothetical protein RUND412_006402 [Rhizina undulata]